ncbi:unnamed protein product, partial [Ixodes persulcatus]
FFPRPTGIYWCLKTEEVFLVFASECLSSLAVLVRHSRHRSRRMRRRAQGCQAGTQTKLLFFFLSTVA